MSNTNEVIKTIGEWLLQMSGGRFARVECPDVYANMVVQAPVFASASGDGRVGDLFSHTGDCETLMVFPWPKSEQGKRNVAMVLVRDDSAKTKWQLQRAKMMADGADFSVATTRMIQNHGYCPNPKLCVVMEG